jgi:hypothetical protein
VQALLRELLIASEDKMGLMAGPEFVYIIASLAKLRAAPDVPWLNRWLAMSRHRCVRGLWEGEGWRSMGWRLMGWRIGKRGGG